MPRTKMIFAAAFLLFAKSMFVPAAEEASKPRIIIPAKPVRTRVPEETMRKIYEEVKTPYKYGIIVEDKSGKKVDCPSVFRHADKWYMVYIIFDGSGYETALAESNDLLNWKPLGKILKFRKEKAWDCNQVAGYVALQEHVWGSSYELQTYDNKYWMSYIGGALKGYETDPLAIGIAWTKTPTKPVEWHRIEQNPVLSPAQEDSREFEKKTLYKSNIIYEKEQTLGYPFVMYYNAKQKGKSVERIGVAVSRDMIHWQRHGNKPVIDNLKGISGDPQITKIGDVWVMFYFGAFWKPKAFGTFACSYDLVHWTKWNGPDLIRPSEPWDQKYAHKPWMIKHKGIVYHFYCAVGDQGRVIALATSKDLRVRNNNTSSAVK
ncbi:MAG: glycoside hydrolase family protein [Planctomycetota bacterium]